MEIPKYEDYLDKCRDENNKEQISLVVELVFERQIRGFGGKALKHALRHAQDGDGIEWERTFL